MFELTKPNLYHNWHPQVKEVDEDAFLTEVV